MTTPVTPPAPAADTIFIQGLRAEAVIGYYPREKEFKQALTLDVEMTVPGPAVFTSDRLHDTLDYGRVAQRIHEELAATHFRLLERVSEHLAQMILTEFPTSRVKLTIAKLGIIAGVARVGVSITRVRDAT
jgi:7,8-dihydroneopterin aldolase/epimerase/oxygenase